MPGRLKKEPDKHGLQALPDVRGEFFMVLLPSDSVDKKMLPSTTVAINGAIAIHLALASATGTKRNEHTQQVHTAEELIVTSDANIQDEGLVVLTGDWDIDDSIQGGLKGLTTIEIVRPNWKNR
jgi:hypothetical protein